MIRPNGLSIATNSESISFAAESRINAIRGIISAGAQSLNTDNFTTLSIDMLVDFPNHPFLVKDDEEMEELVESINKHGIIHPIIVRADPNGEVSYDTSERKYQIIAGHRRKYAAKKAGLSDVPVRILNVDDDTAILMMADTNLRQRETISCSEKARTYKMYLQAMKNSGINAAKQLAEEASEKSRNIFYYVKLNDLIPELIEMTDTGELSLRAGSIISGLDESQQFSVYNLLSTGKVKVITVALADNIKKIFSENTVLSGDKLLNALHQESELSHIETIWAPIANASKKATKYFKKNYQSISADMNEQELEEVLIKAIQAYVENKSTGKEEKNDDL